MAGKRYRSTWRSQSAIPRLGFLLFLLALAIVVWPKLRLLREGTQARIPSAEEMSSLSSNDSGSATTVVVDELPDGLDSEKNKELVTSQSSLDEDLAIDGQTRDLLSLVTDNTLRMAKREMPAYWELIRKTKNSSYEKLLEVSNSKTKFNDFYSQPSKHRGELVSLDIVIRRVTRFEAEAGNSAEASNVFEIWGSTEQSHVWLYVFITDKLPEGFDEETLLRKKAGFAGYFLKLLAYHPGSAPPNTKPLLAPLMIGRLQDIRQGTPAVESNTPWWATWGVTSVIALVTVYFIVRVFLNADQKNRRKRDRHSVVDFDPTLLESDRV